MLLLLQSNPNRPKGGGAQLVIPERLPEVDDDDDILLAAWLMFMRQPYKKDK